MVLCIFTIAILACFVIIFIALFSDNTRTAYDKTDYINRLNKQRERETKLRQREIDLKVESYINRAVEEEFRDFLEAELLEKTNPHHVWFRNPARHCMVYEVCHEESAKWQPISTIREEIEKRLKDKIWKHRTGGG